jgi:hypothetical protein
VGVLAELEIFHSRPIAPTRRVALGHAQLPCDPPPGFGGLLLGGIVAAHAQDIDPDLFPDLVRLTAQLEEGHRIPQPRLRFRFQTDTVGLLKSRMRLEGDGERLHFSFDERATPAQYVLGAVYAAGRLDPAVRHSVMATIRRAMRWVGPVGDDAVAALTGGGPSAFPVGALENPVAWALETLGFAALAAARPGAGTAAERRDVALPAPVPARADVQRRFRQLLREAHPDHGAATEGAAQRIAALREARRILLAG